MPVSAFEALPALAWLGRAATTAEGPDCCCLIGTGLPGTAPGGPWKPLAAPKWLFADALKRRLLLAGRSTDSDTAGRCAVSLMLGDKETPAGST